MAYVKTAPAAIAAAASQLEGIGNSFSAESAAAATPTTALAPAGADEVSAMQASAFSTYGQLYQTVSAEAQAIHQQFVNLLNSSSGSYQDTESANQAGAAASSLSNAASSAAAVPAAPGDGIVSAINALTGLISGSGPFGLSNPVLTSGLFNEIGNFTSAESDLIGLGGGGLLTSLAGPATAGANIGGLGTALASDVGPAGALGGAAGLGGAGGMGAAPILAAAGTGSSIGPMSVPPSWAGGAGIPAASTPVTLASQTWAAAPGGVSGGAPGTLAGMPAVANGGRGGSSFGAPRYGVKPKVMPALIKPSVN